MNIIKRWVNRHSLVNILVELPPSRRTIQVKYDDPGLVDAVGRYFVPFPWMYFLIIHNGNNANTFASYKLDKNDEKYYVFPIGRNIDSSGMVCYAGKNHVLLKNNEDELVQKCIRDFFEIPFERNYLLNEYPVISFYSWQEMKEFPDITKRCIPFCPFGWT